MQSTLHLVGQTANGLILFQDFLIFFRKKFEKFETLQREKCYFTIVSTLRGAFCALVQTVHSAHCMWIPQQAKNSFVAESATLLLFFYLLRCFGFHKKIPKALYRSKLLQKKANLRNLQPYLRNPKRFVESKNK